MLKHVVIAVIACAGVAMGAASHAATSIPMPEAGFALASNGGNGVDTITAPMSGDEGGGSRSTARRDPGPEAVESTSHESAPHANSGHADHAHSATGDAAPAANTAATHKARGNARWQSLLPGLMK